MISFRIGAGSLGAFVYCMASVRRTKLPWTSRDVGGTHFAGAGGPVLACFWLVLACFWPIFAHWGGVGGSFGRAPLAFVRRTVRLPRPREERWRCQSAGCCWMLPAVCCLLLAAGCCRLLLTALCCWLLLQTLVPCCPPRHVPRTPPLLRQGYLTLDCPTQKFPPSAAALQRMAGRFTRFWRDLANGTVPGVG